MIKDKNHSKPTTFINGWYCPQCKKLTEHIYVFTKTHLRYLQCTICKTMTRSKATTSYSTAVACRKQSKLLNTGHNGGRTPDKERKTGFWGRPENDDI